ncbi:CHAD domain-containing protein [Tolypothrix sp. NIES-4075]|uniref:CHAD domain-containing protein n=1 Tax=Tolypothrix sp. NIES-4075 TaxID=2005459 RepID=UPI000B5C4B70|nr:CHAD domain-containing protein [Tolypothrix sp. NIES-4075]GAX40557.1 CHAD domain-containing protein [Tolypothrix sp. NIES-4075]
MELVAQTKLKTLGYYAHEAMKKHFKKTLKWEKTVKKDEDPEALHQMRVGMRRLRTAVSRFGLALDLSKPVSDKNIGKIARRLGTLRDLDVLKESLENTYRPNLPHKEQKSLQTAFDALSKQREDALEGVQATFKDEHYKSLKQGMNEWLENPTYLPIASLPMQELLPDLLLPEVSSLLLDAGWLVGTQVENAKVVIPKGLKAEKIEKELATNGEMLHTLRKQAKRVRYQMELFTELYAESYSVYVADVKNIQDILGSIQDSVVLGEWLTDVFESEIETKLPTFANLLAENRYKLWQQWQPLQERYLKPETRHSFHLTILHPLTV